MQRARSQKAREERREDILAAGEALFAQKPFSAIHMADVAREVGLAKGTLYLYFPTKEALFLSLVERGLGAWFAELEAELERVRTRDPIDEVARLVACTLVSREPLTRLLGLLHAVLEQNLEPASALAFKVALRDHVANAGRKLESILRFLSPGEGALVLLRLHALVVGLRQMADPAPVIRDVLERPDMAALRIDFGPALEGAFRALLRGMKHEARR